jgi:hypothetical protein
MEMCYARLSQSGHNHRRPVGHLSRAVATHCMSGGETASHSPCSIRPRYPSTTSRLASSAPAVFERSGKASGITTAAIVKAIIAAKEPNRKAAFGPPSVSNKSATAKDAAPATPTPAACQETARDCVEPSIGSAMALSPAYKRRPSRSRPRRASEGHPKPVSQRGEAKRRQRRKPCPEKIDAARGQTVR